MVDSQVLGWEVGELVRGAVPPEFVPAVVAITRLGNVVLLLALFTLDYWFRDHERGAHALGLALGGMALITALKALFAEPRPPEAVRLIATGGYSFPSGHATTATIGYGVLAYDLEWGSATTRYGIAGVLVALVAFSRVALGVHFVRDVLAGVVVGLVFLAAAEYLTGHDPRPGFLLAAALGVVALLVSGVSQDSVAEFGSMVGAAVAWESVGEIRSVETRREQFVLLGAGLPVFVAVSYVSLFVDLPLLLVFATNAVLLAGVILAPGLVARLLRGAAPTR